MSLARFGSVWVGLARLARFGSFLLLVLTGKYGNFRRFLQENMGNMGILKRLSTIAMGRSAASHSSFTLPMTAAISFGSN